MFVDRRDAGRKLAARLLGEAFSDPIVLGLPRGGVPVAHEVAIALGAPLDAWVVRKLGAPMNPELGIGAVAPGGIRVVDEATVRTLGVTDAEVDAVTAREMAELYRRVRAYRGDQPTLEVEGRVVILVDDGVATGGTARAAARSLRVAGARRIVLAVPVGPRETVDALKGEVDEVVVLETPSDFRAVGLWYDRFDQTTDEEVVRILAASRAGVVDAPRRARGGGRA